MVCELDTVASGSWDLTPCADTDSTAVAYDCIEYELTLESLRTPNSVGERKDEGGRGGREYLEETDLFPSTDVEGESGSTSCASSV
jgi:hypothetical protein